MSLNCWISQLSQKLAQTHREFGHQLINIRNENYPLYLYEMFLDPRICDQRSQNEDIVSYKVKTQYVQVTNMINTAIKHVISGQSTPMVKCCMVIMFDIGKYFL